MNIEKVKKGIAAKFEKDRIVFWQDADQEFLDQLEELSESDFDFIKLDEYFHFSIKKKIEEPNKPFLLYSTQRTNRIE